LQLRDSWPNGLACRRVFAKSVREHSFERQLRALVRQAIPADPFVEGAEYLLARDPLIGSTDDPNVWFLPMAPIGEKQVALYYAFDNATIWLLGIE
jgi:hypothetical protein